MNGKEEKGQGTEEPTKEDPIVTLLKFPIRIVEAPIDDFNKTAEEIGLRKLPKLSDKLDQLFLSEKKRVRARKKRSKKKSVSDDNGLTAQSAAEEQRQTKAVG